MPPSHRAAEQSLWRIASGLLPATVAVQVLSLGSSLALALLLGASDQTDAYYLALSVPVIVYSILLYAASTGAIPTLTDYVDEHGLGRAASEVLTIVLFAAIGLSLVVSALTFVVLPLVVGSSSHVADLMRPMILELAPYGVTGALAGLLTAILAVRGRYVAAVAVTGFEPLVKAALVLLFPRSLGAQALILGNLIGSILTVGCLWWLVSRQGLSLRVLRRPGSAAARTLIKLSVPLLVSQGALQLNPLVDRATASGVSRGSVTILELGLRLFSAPILLIGIILVNPLTATWAARKAATGFSELSASYARAVLAVVIALPPVIVAGFVLRQHIAELFYAGGAYTRADIHQTGAVTGMLLLGLPAQVYVMLISTLFVVQRDTVFPMQIAFVNVIFNAILDIALRGPLGVPGVALSTSFTMTLLCGGFAVEARRRWGSMGLEQVWRPLVLAIPSSAAVAAVGLLVVGLAGATSRVGNLALVVGVALVGLAIHAAVLKAGGVSISRALPLLLLRRSGAPAAQGPALQ